MIYFAFAVRMKTQEVEREEKEEERISKEGVLRDICDGLTDIDSDWEKRRISIQRIAKEIGRRDEKDIALSHYLCEKIGKCLSIQVYSIS